MKCTNKIKIKNYFYVFLFVQMVGSEWCATVKIAKINNKKKKE